MLMRRRLPPDVALRLVREAPEIAVDTETTGLDPYADRIVGYVVAARGCSVYVPVRHSGGGNLADPVSFEKELARAFADRSRSGFRTIFHNAAFDLWMLGKEGILPGDPLEDTLINAVLCDDDEFLFNLDVCAHRAGLPGKKTEPLLEALRPFAKRKGEKGLMKYFHRLPGDHPLVVAYAEQDGRTTLALWEAQQPLLEARGLARVHALECALIRHLAAIRRRGIRVDPAYGAQAIRDVRKLVEEVRVHFPPEFAPNKKSDVTAYLRSQGVTHFPATPTGKEKTDRAFLETTVAGEAIIRLRKLDKIETAFIEPLLSTHQRAGRIHPELVQCKNDHGKGTHTGRFSCINPNLQQYPKRDAELGKIVRPIIIPDEDFVFAESDVSQQEPRLYAHYSQEASLIEGYNASPPVDVHQITSRLLGIERDPAKTLGLSIFNGMQVPSLAGRLKRSLDETQVLFDQFFAAYPAIHALTERVPIAAARHGFIRTTLGRICHLNQGDARMGVSRLIQGSAADQMKLLLLRACQYAEAHPNIQILMSIHDSLLWQKRRGTKVGEFRRVLEDNSEFYQLRKGEKIPMRVPFPLGTKFGKNWSDASYK